MTTGSVLAQFTITLSQAVSEQVAVEWHTADGTALAGVDYAAAKGTVLFAPGETSKVVDILVYGRAVGSENRSFFVEMLPPTNAILGASIGECIIHVDTTGSTPVTQIIVPTGPQGDSAYQAWLDLGNTGTEEDFINSLKPSAVEIAEEVAPNLNVSNSPLTAEGTETLSNPDTMTGKRLARRVAYVGAAKVATVVLADGDNLITHAALSGDAVDFNSVSLYPRILRGTVVISPEWSVEPGDKILIKSAVAGDVLHVCEYDVISERAVRSVVERLVAPVGSQAFEALRRSYAEAGYNLVDGSFEAGGTLTSATDALLYAATGIAYTGSGPFPQTVLAGTNPGDGGYTAINMEQIRTQLSAAHGGALVKYTPDTVPSLLAIDIEAALRNRRNITDLGAISGVADAAVDARVVASVEAGYVIDLPDEFNYKLSSYGVLFLSTKPGAIICSSGRAKMTASTAGVMLDMPPPFKFENWYFENIDFVGADKQNPASQFMFAAEGEYAANFTTTNCSWDGFHTIYKASLIGTHHYKPDYFGVGDTGAIADTFHWTTSLFSSFNLNEWHAPRIFGKFGRLFQILGGNSNYIYHPWFEKIETVSAEMILLRHMINFQIIGGWLENFKTQFLINLEGDGTENTQSDMIVIDGLHLNNSWAVNDPHMGQPSGFIALVNRLNPQFPGNMYDTKLSFRNISEHTQSVPGWAITRTGSTLNQDLSLHEYINNRLLAGQPNTSGGLTLGGGNPDIRTLLKDFTSNKLDILPSAYQIIAGLNTTGSQKDFVFDNVEDVAYFRRNAAKLIQWSTTFFAPGTNNEKTCGLSTFAWAGGYTQTAFTVLSDESYKSKPLPLDDVLLDAWSEVEFFIYQFLDRIEAKGPDGARWHFGVVAQRVVEAMGRHALDWEKFAFICFDKWDASPAAYDADGNLMSEAVEAGEKFGIRYEEALVLEAALQRRSHQRLLARVEALENK